MKKRLLILLKRLFLRADEYGRTPAEQEIDALTMTIEEGEAIEADIAWGLAWATGDREPWYCTPACRMPHLGPWASQAIRSAYAAAGGGHWGGAGLVDGEGI